MSSRILVTDPQPMNMPSVVIPIYDYYTVCCCSQNTYPRRDIMHNSGREKAHPVYISLRLKRYVPDPCLTNYGGCDTRVGLCWPTSETTHFCSCKAGYKEDKNALVHRCIGQYNGVVYRSILYFFIFRHHQTGWYTIYGVV